MNWPIIPLGEAASFINGYAFKPSDWESEGKEIIRIQNLTKSSGQSNYFSGKIPLKYLVKKGDLLISWSATLGIYEWEESDAWLNQHIFKVVFDKKDLDKSFFRHLISFSLEKMSYEVHGATMKHITKKKFDAFQIPLPPLPIQKKIAAILDEADKLRQLNKDLIAKYDELTQSLFLDMFGDPVTNPKGWEKVVAAEYYEVRGRVGWKGYKKTDLRLEGAVVLGATHVTHSGDIDLEKVVYLSDEKFEESPEIIVKQNDLIFVQRGNTIGKVGLVREDLGDATINPVVLIFRPVKANPLFLLYLLMNKGLNREFVNSNSGSAQPMITQKFMKEFLFVNVPIKLQNQFADRVAEIETQKAQAQTTLGKAEELFNSLLQRAFKGELVKE
ncbi:MAG: restriction endonuclease subunit S [Flavobacteriales bacterium]|nr:restriction endonuclease subunit S [Flavobacteriales bacterium]